MSYVGQVKKDSSITLWLQCVDSSGVAATPTGTPTYRIYGTAEAAIASGNLDASDQDSQTGLRSVSVTAGSGYTAGQVYSARLSWVSGGSTFVKVVRFMVT